MKTIKLLSAGIALLSVASVMPVMAGGAEKGCDVKHHIGKWGSGDGIDGRDFRHLSRELKLSDEQKATLASQRDESKAARDALHSRLSNARTALDSAVASGANDAELKVLADALGDLHAEQVLSGIKARQAFMAVLTDEQKTKMTEHRNKRLERKMDHKHERKESGPT